jgi:hypothetical protein
MGSNLPMCRLTSATLNRFRYPFCLPTGHNPQWLYTCDMVRMKSISWKSNPVTCCPHLLQRSTLLVGRRHASRFQARTIWTSPALSCLPFASQAEVNTASPPGPPEPLTF